MKTVFKGIINGAQYDSVEDYNREISRLLKEGTCFTASTSTEMVQDEPKQENINMLPGLDEWNSNYIDKYIDYTDQQLKDLVDKHFGLIRSEVLKMDAQSKADYKEDIEDAFEYISGDLEDNREGIEQTNKVLEHFEKNRDYLIKSDRVIKAFKGLYGKIKSIL